MLFFHDNKRVFFYLIVGKNRCANVFGGRIIKNIWNTQVFKRKILKNVILHLCCVFLRIMNFPEDIPKIITFWKKCSLYLRMCIFCCTFEHLPWLRFLFSRSLNSCRRSYVRRSLSKLHSGASSSRSYVRTMQPILQTLTLYL